VQSKVISFLKTISFVTYITWFIFLSEFEEMAIGTLKIFDDERTDKVDDVLIVRYFKEFKMDCLDLAIECECEQFVSTQMVQRVLDKIWLGKRNDSSTIVSIFILFLFLI
jgi:hypothetical protein